MHILKQYVGIGIKIQLLKVIFYKKFKKWYFLIFFENEYFRLRYSFNKNKLQVSIFYQPLCPDIVKDVSWDILSQIELKKTLIRRIKGYKQYDVYPETA